MGLLSIFLPLQACLDFLSEHLMLQVSGLSIGVTKSLAMELGEFNIRVNAICPGSVSGDRMERVIEAKAKSTGVSEEELQKDYESMVSLKTFVNKEDIANMALFLLSNEAHKISGQVMTIDGNTERMN